MSINNNNSKLTDIFGQYYEPGSEGSLGNNKTNTEISVRADTNHPVTVFRGTLQILNYKYFLVIKDGGRFALNLKNVPEDLPKYNNKKITVKGTQDGGDIDNAIISIHENRSSLKT